MPDWQARDVNKLKAPRPKSLPLLDLTASYFYGTSRHDICVLGDARTSAAKFDMAAVAINSNRLAGGWALASVYFHERETKKQWPRHDRY
jgi:hypothetical protein